MSRVFKSHETPELQYSMLSSYIKDHARWFSDIQIHPSSTNNAKNTLIIVIDSYGNIETWFRDHEIENTVADIMLYHEAKILGALVASAKSQS